MNKGRNILRYGLAMRNKIGIQFQEKFAVVIYLPLNFTHLVISS